jgi:hypothetical protein
MLGPMPSTVSTGSSAIKGWQEKQRQQSRDKQTADDQVSHRAQKTSEAIGIILRGGGRCQDNRSQAVCRCVDHCISAVQSSGEIHVDLVDQNH